MLCCITWNVFEVNTNTWLPSSFILASAMFKRVWHCIRFVITSASYLDHRGFQNSVGESTLMSVCSWCFGCKGTKKNCNHQTKSIYFECEWYGLLPTHAWLCIYPNFYAKVRVAYFSQPGATIYFPHIRETKLLLTKQYFNCGSFTYIKSGKSCRKNMWNYSIEVYHSPS